MKQASIIGVVFCLGMMACVPQKAMIPVTNASPTVIISPTFMFAPALTATPSPFVATPTRAPTAYPTASLNSTQIEAIENFLDITSPCLLPCWNGLTPGISTSADIQPFYARLGMDVRNLTNFQTPSGHSAIGGYFDPNELEHSLYEIDVYWDESESIIAWIRLNYQQRYPEFLTLGNLVDSLGSPATIELAVQGTEGSPIYYILMDFAASHTAVEIEGTTTVTDTETRICLSDSELGPATIYLYSTGIEPFQYSYAAERLTEPAKYTGLSEAEFLDQLQQHSCVDIIGF